MSRTRSKGGKCLGGVGYFKSGDLTHGVLPKKKTVAFCAIIHVLS